VRPRRHAARRQQTAMRPLGGQGPSRSRERKITVIVNHGSVDWLSHLVQRAISIGL
jgi:hypothetical protein